MKLFKNNFFKYKYNLIYISIHIHKKKPKIFCIINKDKDFHIEKKDSGFNSFFKY